MTPRTGVPSVPGEVTESRFRLLVTVTALLPAAAALAWIFMDGRAEFVAQAASLGVAGLWSGAIIGWSVVRASGAERRWRLPLLVIPLEIIGGAVDWGRRSLTGVLILESRVADLSFLAAPVAHLLGLLWIPAVHETSARARASPDHETPAYTHALVVLDGLVIIGSIGLISWVTVLRGVVEAGTSGVGFAISIAYSLTGALLVVISILIFTFRWPRNRRALGLIGAGLFVSALSVSLFAYVVSSGDLDPGKPSMLMKLVLFIGVIHPLLGCLGVVAPASSRAGRERPARQWTWRVHAYLPYMPLVAAVVLSISLAASRSDLSGLVLYLILGLVALVTLRQMLLVGQNMRLLSSLRVTQAELRHQASHDPLTGLANRGLFTERLGAAVRAARGGGPRPVLVFCDLDGFKAINDTYGHVVGDGLLRAVAGELRKMVDHDGVVARLGGDEFAILLTVSTGEPSWIGQVMGGRILDGVNQPFLVEGHAIEVGASIGIAVAGDQEPGDGSGLLHRADAAMYVAKGSGKGVMLEHQADTA